MKKWLERLKEKMREKDLDGKQIVLSIIIFIVAILFLTVAFYPKKTNNKQSNMLSKVITQKLNNETRNSRVLNIAESDENLKEHNQIINKPTSEKVTLNFTITADKDMDYKVYYTTKASEPFSQEKKISYRGKSGTHSYGVHLPVSQISRFSIEFEKAAGNIKVKDIFLSGSQNEDLNNFNMYQFAQMNNIQVNDDKSISFTSYARAPSLIYYPSLIPEEKAPTEEKDEMSVEKSTKEDASKQEEKVEDKKQK